MAKEEDTKKEENPAQIYTLIERNSRIIYLNDPIDKEAAFKINRALLLLDEISNDPIKIFINSPGGEVNSGFFIFDCIKFVRSPVYVVGAGLVASAAALIYLAVDKKYRLSLPHARFMLHQPLSGSRGVVTDLEIHAKEVEDIKILINEIIAEATSTPIKKVQEDTDRDFWLNAKEAQSYGVVDKIITKKDDFKELFPVPKKDTGEKNEAKKSTTTSTQSTTTTKKAPAKKSNSSKPTSTKKSGSGKSSTTKKK